MPPRPVRFRIENIAKGVTYEDLTDALANQLYIDGVVLFRHTLQSDRRPGAIEGTQSIELELPSEEAAIVRGAMKEVKVHIDGVGTQALHFVEIREEQGWQRGSEQHNDRLIASSVRNGAAGREQRGGAAGLGGPPAPRELSRELDSALLQKRLLDLQQSRSAEEARGEYERQSNGDLRRSPEPEPRGSFGGSQPSSQKSPVVLTGASPRGRTQPPVEQRGHTHDAANDRRNRPLPPGASVPGAGVRRAAYESTRELQEQRDREARRAALQRNLQEDPPSPRGSTRDTRGALLVRHSRPDTCDSVADHAYCSRYLANITDIGGCAPWTPRQPDYAEAHVVRHEDDESKMFRACQTPCLLQ